MQDHIDFDWKQKTIWCSGRTAFPSWKNGERKTVETPRKFITWCQRPYSVWGGKVVKKTKIGKVVTKTFKQNKSGGYKKLRTRAADGYAGVRNNKILSITSNDGRFKKFTARFTNKAVPRPTITPEVITQFVSTGKYHHAIRLICYPSLF